jgi:hypothetical protein
MQTLRQLPHPVKQKPNRPRPRPTITPRLAFPPHAGLPGLLQITVGKACQDYELSTLSSDWGLAYAVSKLTIGGPTVTYHCCLDIENGPQGHHLCDCKGFLQWGRCKHIAALTKLHQMGELGPERESCSPSYPADDMVDLNDFPF